jgi:transcriptional regulator
MWRYLIRNGIDRATLRRVFPIMLGYEHWDLARILGTHRQNITNVINMKRAMPDIRAGIADLLLVPAEEFFREEDGDQADHAA